MTEKKLPCIFGKEIHEECHVRAELSKPNITKWIKPKDKTVNEIVDALGQLLYSQFSTLADFCVSCPFLEKKENQK